MHDLAALPTSDTTHTLNAMNRFLRLTLLCLGLLALGTTTPIASARLYSIDGMVGQVNGRAIYTNAVLDEPMRETLARWGRELPRDTFRQRAAERISVRLNGMVTDALVYGEAKRDLSDGERQGLVAAESNYREQLLREHGQGSPALAEANLIEQTGLNLDQTIEQWRQAAVVSRYMRQKLTPKVNVTRRDIKRYYQENYDKFNAPLQRTIRVIQTLSPEDAEYVRSVLDEGADFAEIAEDTRNQFRADRGGLMGVMAGDQLFADSSVNEATLALNAGECVGPIEVDGKSWFVCVEDIQQPKGVSLMDAQTQIQSILYDQQLREHSERYRQHLFEVGSYNSIEQMTLTLLEIATDRYAVTER